MLQIMSIFSPLEGQLLNIYQLTTYYIYQYLLY